MRPAILLVGLTLSQVAWADCVYTGAKRAYIQCIYDSVLTLASEVLGLQTDVADTNFTVAITQDDVVELHEDFFLLTSRIDRMESDLSVISTETASHGGTIVVLEDSVLELDEAFSVVTSRVDGLETDLGDISTELTSRGITIDIIADTIIEHDETFTLLTSRVTALETTVGTLAADLLAAQGEISGLQGDLADAEARLDAGETAGLRSALISGNSGAISIAQQHGSPFLSGITKLGVGGYRASFAAGAWTSTPHCFCAPFHFGGLSNMICNVSQLNTGVVDIVLTDVAGTVRDRDAWLFCLQP